MENTQIPQITVQVTYKDGNCIEFRVHKQTYERLPQPEALSRMFTTAQRLGKGKEVRKIELFQPHCLLPFSVVHIV